MIRVPDQLSLDQGMAEDERVAREVLEVARLRARKQGLNVETRLIRTRNPGAAIVEEAEHSNAELIYLATAHAPSNERALGPTATYLLTRRPCRVVIESPGAPERTRSVDADYAAHRPRVQRAPQAVGTRLEEALRR